MKHVQIAPVAVAQNGARTSKSASDAPSEAAIAEALLTMARARRAGATFCPSEIARVLAPSEWRPLMPRIRGVASRLQRDGFLCVTQGGRAVDPLSAVGPIRLSRSKH